MLNKLITRVHWIYLNTNYPTTNAAECADDATIAATPTTTSNTTNLTDDDDDDDDDADDDNNNYDDDDDDNKLMLTSFLSHIKNVYDTTLKGE